MTEILFIFWIISTILIIFERKIYRVIIYFGIFSLITSVVYLFLGGPDVAMAEAGISAFATIFFLVCIEKYYNDGNGKEKEHQATAKFGKRFVGALPALLFCAALCGLFIYFMPQVTVSTYLKDLYLDRFWYDVGGLNAVTSIYLGYRVYDTLFEALILVIAVVAVGHLSWYEQQTVPDGRHSEIENSVMAKFTMRIICPMLLIFGAYLIANGHISAGGGFQGGLAVAAFFICRYMVYGIYDMPIKKVIKLEELIFINIIIVPIIAIFTGTTLFAAGASPLTQNIYLIAMNILIGAKVACGFFVLFYRYIAIERLPEKLDKIVEL